MLQCFFNQSKPALVLSRNQLSGKISDSIGECTVLQQLLLDDNLFEGSIPKSFENLKGVSTLNLSMNKLSGTIPEGIGSILDLQKLYQAHNKLSAVFSSASFRFSTVNSNVWIQIRSTKCG